MLAKVYNQKGEEVGQTTLPKEIFDVGINADLLHQVVVAQMANRRITIANTKSRAEVRGGGRKPWRQKGTGRARHGSRRSPIWRGGGITFGPRKDKDYSKKINKKMKTKALFMALSSKLKGDELVVLDDLSIESPKTKIFEAILRKLPIKKGSCLVVLPKKDEMIIRAANNLPQTMTQSARDINAFDLMSFKYLIMPKDSIKVIKETFLKE